MKTTLTRIVSNLSKQLTKSNPVHFSFFPCITLLLFLFSSCNKDKAPAVNTDNTTICKNRPGKISFGRDASEIKYNTQDQPVTITTITYNPAVPSQPPVTNVYAIAYTINGNTDKITKSVNNQTALYYQMEYHPNGQLSKLSRFNAQGMLTATTLAQYDNSNRLSKIITQAAGSSSDVISDYYYANGSLIKKSIQHLYDSASQEFYTADYAYTYFPDRDNKMKSYFEGPSGLLFISNLANESSLQYLPGKAEYQLFFARETAAEKKMLKNIEIIAHRYGASDTTHIDYSYDYAADGFPTVQKGTYTNITRRYVATPFGGSVLLVTPRTNSFERTMNFYCN